MEKLSRSQTFAQQHKTRVYGLLIAIPILLLISLIFYMIASLDGAMFGTP
jgi:hypothetical protein